MMRSAMAQLLISLFDEVLAFIVFPAISGPLVLKTKIRLHLALVCIFILTLPFLRIALV